VRAAYFDRVSLSSTGYHATPDIGYDFKTNTGNPFNYFTYGVACSLVEIDCLTGDHQVSSHKAIISHSALATIRSVFYTGGHQPFRTGDHQVSLTQKIISHSAPATIR
jgi:xanthine dehydrogenase molybdopterin-binding subunit B